MIRAQSKEMEYIYPHLGHSLKSLLEEKKMSQRELAARTAMPGVIKSDFYVINNSWKTEPVPYRYMTEAYYPDLETFEKSFFDPSYQIKLTESLKRISEPLFLISEEVISEEN